MAGKFGYFVPIYKFFHRYSNYLKECLTIGRKLLIVQCRFCNSLILLSLFYWLKNDQFVLIPDYLRVKCSCSVGYPQSYPQELWKTEGLGTGLFCQIIDIKKLYAPLWSENSIPS